MSIADWRIRMTLPDCFRYNEGHLADDINLVHSKRRRTFYESPLQ